jgi:hypothetical protein
MERQRTPKLYRIMFAARNMTFARPVAGGGASIYDGAAGIYAMRSLGGWSGDVVRVKRSSDNTESDFSPTEITDGTLTTWTGANDGRVVTWYDQSGNARNLTASTGPKLVVAGTLQTQGSKPTLLFSSSATEALIRTGMSLVTTSQSVMIIARHTSATNNRRLFSQTDGSADYLTSGHYIPAQTIGSTALASYASSAVRATVTHAANELITVSCVHSGSLISNRINIGTPATYAHTLNKTFTKWSVGAALDDGDRWQGQISEVVIFQSAVSSTIRNDIQSAQMTYIGL